MLNPPSSFRGSRGYVSDLERAVAGNVGTDDQSRWTKASTNSIQTRQEGSSLTRGCVKYMDSLAEESIRICGQK
jgi:hypothetical protein